MREILTADQLREKLRAEVAKAGSLPKWAEARAAGDDCAHELGVRLGKFLRGERPFGDTLQRLAGYRVVYVQAEGGR